MCKENDIFESYNPDAFKEGASEYVPWEHYNLLIDYNLGCNLDSFLEIYPEFVDIEGTAKLLGVSVSTVKLYLRKGILPPPIKSETVIIRNRKEILKGAMKKSYWDIGTIMDWFYHMKEILDIERKHKWKKYGNYCEYFKGKC